MRILALRLSVAPLLVFLAAVLSGCGNEPAVKTTAGGEQIDDPDGESKSGTGDLSQQEPDFSLSAAEYFDEFDRDGDAANEKYKGSVIELRGAVLGMGRNNAGTPLVLVDVGKDALSYVVCATAGQEPWSKVSPGQQVVIRGRLPEDSPGKSLSDCIFVKTGDNPARVMSARELAQEYAADPEAASEAYNGKHLILDGEVIKTGRGEMDRISVLFKGYGDLRVRCQLSAFEKAGDETLPPGAKVRLIGKLSRFVRGVEIVLIDGLLIRERKM